MEVKIIIEIVEIGVVKRKGEVIFILLGIEIGFSMDKFKIGVRMDVGWEDRKGEILSLKKKFL